MFGLPPALLKSSDDGRACPATACQLQRSILINPTVNHSIWRDASLSLLWLQQDKFHFHRKPPYVSSSNTIFSLTEYSTMSQVCFPETCLQCKRLSTCPQNQLNWFFPKEEKSESKAVIKIVWIISHQFCFKQSSFSAFPTFVKIKKIVFPAIVFIHNLFKYIRKKHNLQRLLCVSFTIEETNCYCSTKAI